MNIHSKEYQVISNKFDSNFYYKEYPDIAEANLDPILHYIEAGWKEQRDPCPDFSTKYYLDTNPEIRESGVNPFYHYITKGRQQGLEIKESGYIESNEENKIDSEEYKVVSQEFDREFYLQQNSDIAEGNLDPVTHYIEAGWKEQRDPCPDFSTKYYLDTNLDIKLGGINPFYHYVFHGRNEGRLPFSFSDYLNKFPYKPKISAIVPNYNHGKYLRERLDSIFNQTYDNYELLILDDCSSDDSRTIIEEYQKLYPAKIKVFLNQENSGSVFKQWRKGLSHAEGSLIWICESDDSCESDFLETLVGHFADPSIMIAFGKIQFIDENSVEFEGLDEYREKAAPGIWEQIYIETAHHWFNHGLGVSNLIANVGGCLFRKQELPESVWEKAQGFKACADWYLYVNLAGGGRIAYNPLAKSYFRQHGKNTSVSNYVSDKYYDEHYRVAKFLKNYHGIDDTTLFNFYLRIADHYKHSFKINKASGLKPLLKVNSLIHEKKTYKHIAIAFLGFYLGGGEIFPINLANQLVSMGYIVSILALNHENEVEQIRNKLNPKVPIYYKYLIQEIGVEDFLDKIGVDLVHSHNPGWEYFFANSKVAMKIPYIVTHHGGYEAANIEERHLIKFLKLVNHWVYIADKNLDLFNGIPLNPSIFSKLPNAVPYSEEKFSLTREELDIKNEDFVFGIASRALKTKGWSEAIQALMIAQKKTKRNLYLLLCGDGEEKELLEKDYNLANVKFLGYQGNIHGFYRMCDCCLLPTRFAGESFPLSLIESIQAGTPIIATDVGEIENILIKDDLKVGELIPFETDDGKFINNLAGAMGKMFNQDLYSFLVDCTNQLKLEYSMEKIASKYHHIYSLASNQ